MGAKSRLYKLMSGKWSWPFLFILPALWVVFVSLGWTKEDIVEERVSEIWIATDGDYYEDKEYKDSLGMDDSTGASTFLGMALSREEGTNLFTEKRLEEIRARMELAEGTTVEHKGITYTWDDVCLGNNAGLNTAYKFPCVRLSPMDLFQEARWYFDEDDRLTWYNELIKKRLVLPRVGRFGTMTQSCSSQGGSETPVCDLLLALRTDNGTLIEQLGYPKGYNNTLLLFDDIGSLEMNHPCKKCIEENFEASMEQLTQAVKGIFGVMAAELQRLIVANVITDETELNAVSLLLQKVGIIYNMKTSRADVEDFNHYYVLRGLYAELGYGSYMRNYELIMSNPDFVDACTLFLGSDNCPTSVTEAEARQKLLKHADNTFSSVNTAGSPFPFWKTDKLGDFLKGANPLSGSGIDMSGDLLSAFAYFDVPRYGRDDWSPVYGASGYPDINSATFKSIVESDPIFAWFMAGQTEATSHCFNGPLPGPGFPGFELFLVSVQQNWCTKYDTPYETSETRTQQHFAKMFYDLLTASDGLLGIEVGVDDPYTWTTGQGCGYSLGGSRNPYTNFSDESILYNASRELYFIDEGVNLGALDRNLLIGGSNPAVGEYDFENPLKKVHVMQSLYVALTPQRLVEKVKNCNRPSGPVNITEDDANEILMKWKEEFTDVWSKDWDNDNVGEVKFVGFFDSVGASGTTEFLLEEITLSNGRLTTISIVVIALVSALFLVSFDVIESRVLITLFGVGLVVLSFFAALGFGLMIGIKINVNIAWTLPFVIIGLGVDDMYIVLLSLKERTGYTRVDFISAMKEVIIPVTMTSLVNASMFAIMCLVNIPAVYKTAQMALISVVFLYLTILFCFPAYCWLDLKRQAAGRMDVLICLKSKNDDGNGDGDSNDDDGEGKGKGDDEKPGSFLYAKIYHPLVLGDNDCVRYIVHAIVWIGAIALLAVGIYGITSREVGLGLEDFFPKDNQAHTWATVRTKELASWPIKINWGELDYTDPDTQMQMIQQFEDIVESPHVSHTDTDFLWLADFQIWGSTHCTANFDRDDAEIKECGADQMFQGDENDLCTVDWVVNKYDLKVKRNKDPKDEVCYPFDEGICRSSSMMHSKDLDILNITEEDDRSWCPVIPQWSDEKLQYCLGRWRYFTGGSGGLILEDDATPNDECAGEEYRDATVVVPIKYSEGPGLFSYGLTSHSETVDLIDETREICDEHATLHCWMTGIPYDYWEQYLYVDEILVFIAGVSVAVGFGVAAIFLFSQLKYEQRRDQNSHSTGKILVGSLAGAFLIAMTCVLTLIPVIGLSVLSNVNFTAFSNMSFVLSVGFAVEYSVHVVHRFLEAPLQIKNSKNRVEHTMSFLILPLTLSFISSTIGVVCLAFTEFEFNRTFFFRPLIIVMFTTYYYGCLFLPVLLSSFNWGFMNLGKTTRGSILVKEALQDENDSSVADAHDDGYEKGGDIPEDNGEKDLNEVATQ